MYCRGQGLSQYKWSIQGYEDQISHRCPVVSETWSITANLPKAVLHTFVSYTHTYVHSGVHTHTQSHTHILKHTPWAVYLLMYLCFVCFLFIYLCLPLRYGSAAGNESSRKMCAKHPLQSTLISHCHSLLWVCVCVFFSLSVSVCEWVSEWVCVCEFVCVCLFWLWHLCSERGSLWVLCPERFSCVYVSMCVCL